MVDPTYMKPLAGLQSVRSELWRGSGWLAAFFYRRKLCCYKDRAHLPRSFKLVFYVRFPAIWANKHENHHDVVAQPLRYITRKTKTSTSVKRKKNSSKIPNLSKARGMRKESAQEAVQLILKVWRMGLIFLITLPETNIAPENNPLEKEIPIGNHHF